MSFVINWHPFFASFFSTHHCYTKKYIEKTISYNFLKSSPLCKWRAFFCGFVNWIFLDVLRCQNHTVNTPKKRKRWLKNALKIKTSNTLIFSTIIVKISKKG